MRASRMHGVRALLAVAAVACATIVETQAPAPVHLTVAGHASANVWLTADGARVAAAWGARRGDGTDVFAAFSSDGGRAFTAPVRVNDRPGVARVNGEMAPRISFVARPGLMPAVDVLWISREAMTTIRISRSTDGGRSFGPSRELQGSGAAGDRGWAALTSDPQGATHALWLDHRGMAAAHDAAAAPAHEHGAAQAAGSATGEQRDAAAAAQKSALYYSNSGAARQLTTGVCYCCKTALAAGADGAVYAAWRHVYPGNMRDITFTMSRDGGRSFSPPARVSEDKWALDGCPEDGPAMAIDAAGAAHVVWPTVVAQPTAHKALFYSTTRDGRSFSPRMRVSPTGRNIAHPQIVLAPGGRMSVFWDELAAGRRRVFVSRKEPAGGFGAAETLSDGVTASYPMPVFAGGAYVVAWTEGSGDDSHIVVRRLPVQ